MNPALAAALTTICTCPYCAAEDEPEDERPVVCQTCKVGECEADLEYCGGPYKKEETRR